MLKTCLLAQKLTPQILGKLKSISFGNITRFALLRSKSHSPSWSSLEAEEHDHV